MADGEMFETVLGCMVVLNEQRLADQQDLSQG